MAKTTVLQDVLARDLTQKIEPAVKVYDRATLADDLRQFVITDALADEFEKFLDAFTESLDRRLRGGSGGYGMAVWISGFFGSGKSHVAKVLGHLLENDIVEPEAKRRAVDIFKLHLDDPTLARAGDIKANLAEVRNKAWCKTIAFEIKSKLDQANHESVTVACLRAFYESLGLSSTIWLARLERKLQSDGLYANFEEAYREATGRSWQADRPEHGYYGDEIAAALAQAVDKPVPSAAEMIATYKADHAGISPEGLAQEWAEFLQGQADSVKPREPHLIYVIDEMGQFIGDSEDRIHELQSIVEQAGVQGRGRIWLVCTSQEALDKVVDRTGLKLSALGKLDYRFCTKIALTSEDVQRVVHDRLLRKKMTTVPTLAGLYAQAEGQLAEMSQLHLERHLATLDEPSFVASYPLLPHTIPLVQELFNAMRGFKLSGGERSMIGLVQGTLRKLAQQPMGILAPLDALFDQVTDELCSADYLGSTGIKLIREADKRVPDTPLSPSRVLKALWLISRVSWVPRTPEVIGKLLAEHLDLDLARQRDDVQATLDALQRAGLVGRDEATGQYRYLSEKERGIEEDIIDQIRDYGVGVAKRRATQLLKERVLTRAKLSDFKLTLGRAGILAFSLSLDGEVLVTGGEITVSVSSPLSAPDLESIQQENRAFGTKGRTLWWIAAEEASLTDKLKRLEALYKVPDQPEWKNDRSDETVRVVKEKEKERSILENHLAGQLESCLKRGTVYYSGESDELDGSKELRDIAQEFLTALARHLYTRFDVADKAFDEANIPTYLKRGSVHRLDPELGLFDAQGNLSRSSPLVEAVFEELQRRQDESLELHGKAVAEHFQRIPFGWPEPLLRLILAAMLRGGALYLQPDDSDQRVYEMGDARAEPALTKPLRFRKTRFYPTTGGLTPDEVRRAKEALIALGEQNVPDSALGLAERLRSVAARMENEAEMIAARVHDLELPVPDTYQGAEPATAPAAQLKDPVASVRQFIADAAAWKEVADFLKAYGHFSEQGRDHAFRSYVAALRFARACPELFEGEQGQRAREQLAEFDAVVGNRNIMSSWKALQEAALAVLDRYRQVYIAAHQACEEAVAALRAEVQASDAFTRLEPARRAAVEEAFFGPSSPLMLVPLADLNTTADLLAASQQRKVSELQALRLATPSYRPAVFQRCDAEWTLQQPQMEPDQRKVHRIDLQQRCAGRRFVSVDEFQTFWSALGEEITQKLEEGFEVVVEG